MMKKAVFAVMVLVFAGYLFVNTAGFFYSAMQNIGHVAQQQAPLLIY